MSIQIRPVTDTEAGWAELVRIDALAFGSEEETDNDDRGVMELDRAVLAYDGDTAVGCAALFSLDLSLPGGSAPTAGVTWVGVLPTHRRRGVMTALLADRHRAALDAGEPLAALWASQSAIYPRFGYGAAAHSLRVTVPHGVTLDRAPVDDTVTVELVDAAEDAAATRQVYDAVRSRRPGVPALDDRWHDRSVADRPADRGGWSPLRTFVARRATEPVGYARFQQKHDWRLGVGDGTVRVVELVALDPGGAAAVWRHLHALESMTRTEYWNLPVDDPLLLWLSEVREVDMRLREQLYVRVLDVPGALTSRRYRVDLDLVVDVDDPQLPANHRRWRLACGPSGAECTQTSEPADLRLRAGALGAALLGSTSLLRLASAGSVTAGSAAGLERASLAFGHEPAAWCPWVF